MSIIKNNKNYGTRVKITNIIPEEPFYVEDISGLNNVLSITKANTDAPTIEVFKSTDGTNWASMGTTSTTPITATVPPNGKLYLKATAATWGSSDSIYNCITASGSHNIGGNIMSLIYDDGFKNQTTFAIGSQANFCCLFRNNTTLINANQLLLPATTNTDLCYEYMFRNCTSLVTPPKMSVTTIAHQSCWGMFEECTSLISTPVLLATTLAETCYAFMFQGCTNLATVITYAQNISAGSCLYRWLNSAAPQGNFFNLGNPAPTYPSGNSGIPSGWTEHTSL